MVGDILAKATVRNQPPNEVLERFVVIGMMSYDLVVVIVPSCIRIYSRSLHPGQMFPGVTILYYLVA